MSFQLALDTLLKLTLLHRCIISSPITYSVRTSVHAAIVGLHENLPVEIQ